LRRVCWPFPRICGKRSRRDQEAEGDEEVAEEKTVVKQKDWKPAEAGSPVAPKLTRTMSLPTRLRVPNPDEDEEKTPEKGLLREQDEPPPESGERHLDPDLIHRIRVKTVAVAALASRPNDSTPPKKMNNSDAANFSPATTRTNFTAKQRAKGATGEGTFAKPSPPKKQKINHLPVKINGSTKESRSAWLDQAKSMATPEANIMGVKVPFRPKILSAGSCGFTGTSIKTNVEIGGKVA